VKRILITSGPTWVPIDDVRIISNRSSGQLGRILTQEFRKRKAYVHLLEGPLEFNDFLKSLKKEVKNNYDIVIHAAAVSDYQLKKPFKHKLSSQLKSLKLEFIPTVKIINLIKRIVPYVFLVGFKLEPALTKENVYQKSKRLFEEARCNLVVANCVKDNKYQGYILHNKSILAQASSREGIAKELVRILDL